VIRYFYHPTTTAAFNATPENMGKDLEWKASAESRRKTLKEVRDAEGQKASGYAWIDQKAGVVQLPINRAMELTLRDLAAKQQVRQIRDLPADPARPKL
jgi:hypothetical protein